MSCCSCISTFPELCAMKLCCFRCNPTSTPDLTADWLCTNHCLCCYHHFGFKELLDTQICCLGPCTCSGSSKRSITLTTSIPVSIIWFQNFCEFCTQCSVKSNQNYCTYICYGWDTNMPWCVHDGVYRICAPLTSSSSSAACSACPTGEKMTSCTSARSAVSRE